MIRQLAKAVLASPLGWRVAQPLRRGGVTVLTFHRVVAGDTLFPGMPLADFREQMRWVKRRCTPIWPEQLPELVGTHSVDRPPVLVTFDDGYRDYHDCAYPVLSELEIPAVVFLPTQPIDSGAPLWTDLVQWAVHVTTQSTISPPWNRSQEFRLDSGAARTRLVTQSKALLKSVPNAQRVEWLKTLVRELDVDRFASQLPRQMLCWDEIRATRKWTRYGGHSHTHPILSRVDATELDFEIETCRERIREELGAAPRHFAYPNGLAGDFNEGTKAALKKHGFEMSFASLEGINGPDFDPLEIRRQFTGSTPGDVAARIGRA